MHRNKILSTLLILLAVNIAICQSANQRLDYIEKYKKIAQEEMERTGVPASIKLAQAILESDGGKSVLSRKANNHFGIKCGGDWNDRTFYRVDDEKDKKGNAVESCFRVYKNPESSFIAHSEFLRGNKRYDFLFSFDHDDFRKWAHGLKKAGYATNPKYPALLIKIIENYSLHLYDDLFLPAEPPMMASNDNAVIMEELARQNRKKAQRTSHRIVKTAKVNDIDIVYAEANETPESIAAKTDVSLKRIMKYNENLMNTDQTLLEKTVVFLQPKRRAFRGRKKFHKVKNGETIAEISQKYGIRIDKLLKRNRLSDNEEPLEGAILKIRGKRVDESLRIPTREVGLAEAMSKTARDKAVDKYATSISDFEAPPSLNGETSNVQSKNKFGIERLRKNRSKPRQDNSIVEIKQREVTKRPRIEEEKPVYRAPISSDNYDTANESSNAQFKVDTAPAKIVNPSTGNNPIPSSNTSYTQRYTEPNPTTSTPTYTETRPTIASPSTKVVPSTTMPPTVPTKYHTIIKGETLYRLSKMYGKSVDYLKQVNNLSSNTLSIGQKLIVN